MTRRPGNRSEVTRIAALDRPPQVDRLVDRVEDPPLEPGDQQEVLDDVVEAGGLEADVHGQGPRGRLRQGRPAGEDRRAGVDRRQRRPELVGDDRQERLALRVEVLGEGDVPQDEEHAAPVLLVEAAPIELYHVFGWTAPADGPIEGPSRPAEGTGSRRDSRSLSDRTGRPANSRSAAPLASRTAPLRSVTRIASGRRSMTGPSPPRIGPRRQRDRSAAGASWRRARASAPCWLNMARASAPGPSPDDNGCAGRLAALSQGHLTPLVPVRGHGSPIRGSLSGVGRGPVAGRIGRQDG